MAFFVPRPVEPATEPVKPTVIRAAATDAALDGAALTPPSVPEPADPLTPDDGDDEVIDLREPTTPATDSASDEPGTRWTRSRR